MTKMVAAALLAATAMVPAAALAQDAGGHPDHREWHGGGGERGGPGEGAPRPQPQAQPQVQAQAQVQPQRGGERPAFQPGRQERPAFQPGGGGQFRGNGQPGVQAFQQPQRAPDAAARGFGDRGGYRGPDGGYHAQGGAVGQPYQPGQPGARFQQGQPFAGQQPQGYRGAPAYAPPAGGRPAYGYNYRGAGNPGYAPYRGGPDRQDFYRDQRGFGDRQAWNRGWRQDPRYNWGAYRGSHYSLYNLAPYYAPRGWDYGYRRFGIGLRIDSLLFAPDYWIDDPWEYRLPPAYGEYRWVRYYGDALLVDIETGEVVDVVYGIFY